ncbi:MAG TPA: DinB family protein [Actinomycetes bacterium]|nr:DinB family protein [Actinomycetes bacterium]
MPDIDWSHELIDQLDWHWSNFARPRFDSLTQDEYLWEPVADCWSIRPADADTSVPLWGTGPFRMEQDEGNPTPAPVTTIAWRLGHMIVEVLGERVYSHFDGPQITLDTFSFAGQYDEALSQLDGVYADWIAGVRALGLDGLNRPCGPSEGPYADAPLAALVLHINREMLHHSAEVLLLRDLYRVTNGSPVVGPSR